MADTTPRKFWPPKRVAALVLTLVLCGLAIYRWHVPAGDQNPLPLLCMGIVLGTIYTIRGGSLPDFIHRASHSRFVGGTGIHADDDPRNLPLKIYLPILLAVIAAAALAYFYFQLR